MYDIAMCTHRWLSAARGTAALLCLALLCSCNNSVFIDEIAPVQGYISLKAGAEPVAVAMQSKGLTSISLYSDYESETYTTFYNQADEQLSDNAPFNEVKRIDYFTPRIRLEIIIDKDQLKFIEIDNTYPEPISIDVLLHYDVISKNIKVTLAPDKPMVIQDLFFNLSRANHSFISKQTDELAVNNSSDKPQIITLYPFKNIKSSIEITAEHPSLTGISGRVPIPGYEDNEWGFSSGNYVDVTIGKEVEFEPRLIDVNKAVEVEIAPESSVTLKTFVRYAMLSTTCNAWCKKPNSGDVFLIDNAKTQILEPIDYHINIQ